MLYDSTDCWHAVLSYFFKLIDNSNSSLFFHCLFATDQPIVSLLFLSCGSCFVLDLSLSCDNTNGSSSESGSDGSNSDFWNQSLRKKRVGGCYYFTSMLLTMMASFTRLVRAPVLILVALMSSVAVVSAQAVQSCTDVDANGHLSIVDGTTSIAFNAFSQCATLKSIDCK